jgi:hypothetical protein
MRVRLTVGLAVLVGALSTAACTVKEADDGSAGASGAAAGTGGTAGASAGGAAGETAGGTAGAAGSETTAGAGGDAGSSAGTAGAAGGDPNDPCVGVPTEGICQGNSVTLCEQPPPGSTGQLPRLVTNDCGAQYTCKTDAKGAYCDLNTACLPGESRCSVDGTSVETCKTDGSAYEAVACGAGSACTALPSKPASCEAQPQAGGTAETLKGCISFERKGMDTSGPTALSVEPAVLQFVAIYNGANYIGSAITGASDGCFEAELTEPATETTTVYVFAMDFDAEGTKPLVAVAHYPGDSPTGGLPKTSTEYWNWSNQQEGCGEGIKAAVQLNKDGAGKHVLGTVDHDGDPDGRPDMLIPEVCGSGAVRIFQWVRFGMVRLAKDHLGLEGFIATDGKNRDIATATENLPQDSIAVYWEKGKDVACGACFSNKGNGPFHIDPEGDLDDLYDTGIYISGTEGNPTQWSYSVLSHELGHWVMANYSRTPGEGGVHYVGQASAPGLAYSEGWATAFGQWNASFAGNWDPTYIDTQDGTTFFVDIEKANWTNGALQTPSASGGIDQKINENIVASMIFKLNADGSAVDAPISGGQGLGPDALFKSFISPRVAGTANRGYAKVDLIDFFDGGRCTEAFPDAAISAVSSAVTFPWDSKPQCN